MLPSGGIAARHRKGVTAERFLFLFCMLVECGFPVMRRKHADDAVLAVTHFRRLASMQPEEGSRAEIMPECPSQTGLVERLRLGSNHQPLD
ncbi:hypothetical protein T265_05242 [Opisthorchis viverrini]|uniref:Uncharacterized protein n=1 Tax=Opisthorchis viverrini TaxID=6198 RepID=A0A074ZPM2_OPIVI|nr:hypothetical protein T265_05242 [Opisthorchis viverrini]KER27752.1 hypothetical protein T265_05242 [Opisthorchis viverrini]